MFHYYLYDIVVGPIPASFCNSSGISIDVSGSDIACYSGCLTSSYVFITGASSNCHDNFQLRLFVFCVCISLGLVLLFSYGYRQEVKVECWMSLPTWCACPVWLSVDPTTSPT